MRNIVIALALVASACSYIPGTKAHLIALTEGKIIASAGGQDEVTFQNAFATDHFVCGEINPAAQTMSEWEPFAYSLATGTLIIMPHTLPGDRSIADRMALFPGECVKAGSLAMVRRQAYQGSLRIR